MSDESCFHTLREGGIVRQLAAGVNARIVPGVNAMLSVALGVAGRPHARCALRGARHLRAAARGVPAGGQRLGSATLAR